jgi:DNA-binding transcriptional ArsR family regulator
VRSLSHPALGDIQLPAVFHALSDPARLRIVRDLAGGQEQNCGDLNLPLAKSTLSHHFKVLRDAGLTRTRVDGTWRFISLRLDDLDTRFPGLFNAIFQSLAADASSSPGVPAEEQDPQAASTPGSASTSRVLT